jgi:hypothetical protein
LEEYSAHHAASYEEIGNWPARRFEAAWASHVARRALDSLDDDQRMMIQVVLASGAEDPQEKLAEVQQHFNGLRARIVMWHEEGLREEFVTDDDDFVDEKWW